MDGWSMRRGIIYIFANWFIEKLYKLNIVEHFKNLIAWYSPSKEYEITFKSNAIDIFILFKWMILFFIPVFKINEVFSLMIVGYLAFFNIFTYFYHHVWNSRSDGSKEATQRRFITFVQAVAYNIFAFAFFYQNIFYAHFEWKYKELSLSPLFFSLATTFASSTEIATPNSATGAAVPIIQTLTSFIFLTLILSHTSISGEKK